MPRLRVLPLLVLAACSSADALPSLSVTAKGASRTVKLDAVVKKLPPERFTTKAPAYHGATKTYLGVDLGAFLAAQGGAAKEDDLRVTFVCADGYRAQISGALLRRHKAVLAWSEVDAGGKPAPLEVVKLSSGKPVDPGPLYVVWEEGAVAQTYPNGWPFAVVGIELSTGGSPRDAIDPKFLSGDEEASKGFAVFERICLNCHTVNGVGGNIGPELNRPVNVTEYFMEPYLQRYIRDWTQIRAPRGDERMPRLAELLSEADTELVVRYLRFMRFHK